MQNPYPDDTMRTRSERLENGYEYFVDSTRIVYVFQRAKNKFRIYLIQGDAPNVSMKHDKHGQYFTVRSESTATAEKIIDNTFHNRVAIP